MRRGGARFEVLPEKWAAYRMHRVNKTALDPASRKREIAAILGGPVAWSAEVR